MKRRIRTLSNRITREVRACRDDIATLAGRPVSESDFQVQISALADRVHKLENGLRSLEGVSNDLSDRLRDVWGRIKKEADLAKRVEDLAGSVAGLLEPEKSQEGLMHRVVALEDAEKDRAADLGEGDRGESPD
ncbi:hypothetical protein ACFLSJ_04685 [Verrucomicrobiota bacterium]